MNWVIVIDMYTLMCIKLMTNKSLLYKKINKIKFKNKKRRCGIHTHTHTHTHTHKMEYYSAIKKE